MNTPYLPTNLQANKTTTQVFGVVLAGGQSSRMTVDKATLSINGKTNLERARATLKASNVSEVVVSGVDYIPDHYPQGGPLAGIISVLLSEQLPSTVTALLVMPVDMPLLTVPMINSLIEHGDKNNMACCYKSFNLPIYLPVTNQLRDFLTTEFSSKRFTKFHKGPSFKHLLKQIGCKYLDTPNSELLANANTPEQWEIILRSFNEHC